MRRILIIMLTWSSLASATTYYVSSSTGSDSNNGTSSATAWKTIAHVNGQSFNPGDSILFKRGDVWNESLAPASSGSSGNPITFDAYGTGAAPTLTGYYAVPPTAWVLVTGNAWKAAVPATYTTVNFCLFGSVWGQKVAAATSNLTAQWNFYLANGFIYVYSQGNPAAFYNEPIVPMALSNVPVINVNGQSWLTFQHFLVNWFDQYGIYMQGTSDHLVFANIEADSMIPQGTQPLGFYVDESAPGPGDIKIYNSEAHLNYDGFRFDGAATAITMVNDKGYANRDGALVDNTGAVTYSYCHFYASSLAVAGSTDVEWTSGTGPIAGPGNIAADTAPAVQVYQRYPAQVTLTVDDSGMTPGADTYYSGTVLPIADAAGVPVGAAITVGYPLAQTLVSEFQGWVNAGRDVTAHSMSHTYYTNTDALEIQYTGSGTAAALSISDKTLTVTVTGASDSVSYNLAQGQTQGTILGLQQALAATGKFTTSYLTPCQGPYGTGCSAYTAQALLAQDLADVSGQDVKTSVYHMELDVTRLTTDEITLSRQWMTANLTGLPATPVYVYPGGYETTTMQGITEGVPYGGARGALKEDLGVKDTYADGFNVQNITSFGVNPSWMGLAPAVLNQKIQALVWKESAWGVPWGIFWHWNWATGAGELSATEITNLIADFKASGATMQTNTSLVNWLLAGTQETGTDGNYYYKSGATSMQLDFRPTKNSPVVDAGQNLGAAYALDINGVNQNTFGSGWEIGAHVYEGFGTYGGGVGSGSFTIGPRPNEYVYSLTSQQPLTPIEYSLNTASIVGIEINRSYVLSHLWGNTSSVTASNGYGKCITTDCGAAPTGGAGSPWGTISYSSYGNYDTSAFYWSQSTDPYWIVSGCTYCVTGWTSGPVHIPTNALWPGANYSGDADAQFTVWDQVTGEVVSVYGAPGFTVPTTIGACPGGGHAGTYADPCVFPSYYSSAGATASYYASRDWQSTDPSGQANLTSSLQFAPFAGTNRVNEFAAAGRISHAEYDSTDCVSAPGGSKLPAVFPGTGTPGTLACSSGKQNTYRPQEGMYYFADYTDAQLACLDPAQAVCQYSDSTNIPKLQPFQMIFLTRFAHYGSYIGETSNSSTALAEYAGWHDDVATNWHMVGNDLGSPFWSWAAGVQSVSGSSYMNCFGPRSGNNPSAETCSMSTYINIPPMIGITGATDQTGNSCSVGHGCDLSGHVQVIDPCVVKTYAGQSGGC
jgi:hypothetical protein